MGVVAQIHRLAFFGAMPHMPVLHSPDEDLAFYSNVVFPKAEIWLIEEATIAGFIALQSGWVENLYVHPAHQKRGLGSRLIALSQDSQPSLRLWTFQCNSGARRFYERHGFRIDKATDGAGNEERQPDLLYTWSRCSGLKRERPDLNDAVS